MESLFDNGNEIRTVQYLPNYPFVDRDIRNEMSGYRPPWMDLTAGLISSSIRSVRRVPESWSPAGALNSNQKSSFGAPGSHQRQRQRHELTSTYQYAPLAADSDDIRILHLLPGQENDLIRTRLQSCSLGSPPSYEAISYAWGSRSDNAVVIVSEGEVDYSVEVPQSVHGALKQLRNEFTARAIWADAICMNQGDDEEKNHQVRLMRRIYQGATRVVIWLGDDYKQNHVTSHLFNLISQMYHRDFKSVPPLEDLQTWREFERLFRNPWFCRVWCLQEAALATSAQVMLGKHSAPWEYIGFAATWFRCLPLQLLHDGSALVGVYNACLIYALSHVNERHQQHVSFLQLLALTRPFVATDVRDKIYGILGIPTKDSDPDAGVPFLEPDYTKTLPEVYIDCALAIIRRTQSLRILSYVQHERLHKGMAETSSHNAADQALAKVPSWVPCWHQYFSRTLAPTESEKKTFKASASLNVDSVANTDVRGFKLITHGARISHIRTVSCLLFNKNSSSGYDSTYTAEKVCLEVLEPLKASTASPTELLHTFSTVLTAGKDWYGCVIEDIEQHVADFIALMYNPSVLSDDPEADLHRTRRQRHRVVSGNESPLPRPYMLEEFLFRPRTDLALPPITKVGQAHRFQAAMRNACTWRRVLVTEDGHVGLGPQVARPGDVVCILKHAIVPFLLRPEAGTGSFKLVGEAYIQGVMFGEFNASQVEQFVLSDQPFLDSTEAQPGENQFRTDGCDSSS